MYGQVHEESNIQSYAISYMLGHHIYTRFYFWYLSMHIVHKLVLSLENNFTKPDFDMRFYFVNICNQDLIHRILAFEDVKFDSTAQMQILGIL